MASEKWLEAIREDFPVLKNRRNGKPPVYFDNACTTLVPEPVIKAINEYYQEFPACGGGRSRYWFTGEIINRIEGNAEKGIKGSRRIIKEFIHAGSEKEIIFTLNASHAINLVALGFKFKPGDVVLLTDKEHNSNLVPWLRLQDRDGHSPDCRRSTEWYTACLSIFTTPSRSAGFSWTLCMISSRNAAIYKKSGRGNI